MESDDVAVLQSTGKPSNEAAATASAAAAAFAVESADQEQMPPINVNAIPEPVPDRNIQEEEEVAMDELLALDIENSGLMDVIPAGKIRAGIKFSLEELVEATDNFRADCCLGEGTFGKIYKGFLKSHNKVVTVKQLKLEEQRLAEIKKFATEIVMLSIIDHPNIVELLGYCIAGEERLLVYDIEPLGLLDHHLFNLAPGQKPLYWTTRMKIAAAMAKCLQYLHKELDPPIMFRDLNPSSILLGTEQDPKLCNFGLATFGLSAGFSGGPWIPYSCVPPEVAMLGCMTIESDIYSLGALLLQLITRRTLYDPARVSYERSLPVWGKPKPGVRKKCPIPADPLLMGDYPREGLDLAYDIGAKCTTKRPKHRPSIHEVIEVLDFLVSQKWDPPMHEEMAAMHDLLALDIENSGLKDLIPADKIRAGAKFPLEELVEATDNFRADCCLGEGSFGKIYKGFLKSLNKVVTVKQLKLEGLEGIKKFATEIVMLSVTDHPDIVELLGYCIAGEERLLVYDIEPSGLLDHHLFNLASGQKPLDWTTRMKIAASVAKCLKYLHKELYPPILFRDLNPSSVLLGKELHPKLCNFGLATFGRSTYILEGTRVPYSCIPPEVATMNCITTQSDIYCLGALLLQLITCRALHEPERKEQGWALTVWEMPKPGEGKRCPIPADPLLMGDYPREGLDLAYDIGAKCTTIWPTQRPTIHAVIEVLGFLVSQKWDPPTHQEMLGIDDLLALDIEMSGLKDLIPADKIKTGIKFPLEELVEATDNFRADRCLGEGSFGKIYKGFFKSLNKFVTVKQLKPEGLEGIKKFATEIVMLSITDHPNIVELLGYCIVGEERLLVYDIEPSGLLDHHLFNLTPGQKPMDWTTRMKIAAGVAKCLEYLHQKLDPPIMFRDLNPSSILLSKEQDPKLCNFGLATFGRSAAISEGTWVPYSCIPPEVATMNRMTTESDIYCLGALLLQLITCRALYDPARKEHERAVTMWEMPKPGKWKKCPIPADPLLKGDYPREGLDLACDIGGKCTTKQPEYRPTIHEVIEVLDYLVSQKWDHPTPGCCFFRRN